MDEAADQTRGPEQMRELLGTYVTALHDAYLGAGVLLAPGERAALPLVAAPGLTVVVAAAQHLHLLATADRLPAPRGQEVQSQERTGDLSWTLRFYDAVVLPELGLVDESTGPDPDAVRRILGIADVVYHLSVSPGSGLTLHHAQHAGTALANQHAAAARDGQALRNLWSSRAALVDELVLAERLGLHHSVRLLASALAPDDDRVARAVTGDDDAEVRRALLAAARGTRVRA